MKGQIGQIIILIVEFVAVVLFILAIGPILYGMCANIPLGFVFQLFIPGPQDAALGTLKALVDSGLLTGASFAAIFK